MPRSFSGLLFVALASTAQADPASAPVRVGQFSQGALDEWESRSFKGQTSYSLVSDPELGRTVVRADAAGSASGRFKRVKVDLAKTPYLNWSWKVLDIYPNVNEDMKAGDDFPARVYVVSERGVMGLSSISLNYVWASTHGANAQWPSPYTAQVRLLAIDSGSKNLGRWVRHKRDLRKDLKAAFGEEVATVEVVAFMTDADDHKGRGTAFYGDIWFSAD